MLYKSEEDDKQTRTPTKDLDIPHHQMWGFCFRANSKRSDQSFDHEDKSIKL